MGNAPNYFGLIQQESESVSKEKLIKTRGFQMSNTLIMWLVLFFFVFCIFLALQLHRDEARRKVIYAIVTKGNIRSIQEIAVTSHLDVDKVEKHLQKSINNANRIGLYGTFSSFKLFKNAYIDFQTKSIVLASDKVNNQESEEFKISNFLNVFNKKTGKSQTDKKKVTCENCGADNIVNNGVVSKCEYCGTAIV